MPGFLDVEHRRNFRIQNAYVPKCCLPQDTPIANTTIDSLALVDIDIADGVVNGISMAGGQSNCSNAHGGIVNVRHSMVLPTFVDLHTHIGEAHTRIAACYPLVCIYSCRTCKCAFYAADKAQTGERSRNIDGTLSGADRSTASDAEFWNQDDVYRCYCTHCMLTLSSYVWCLLLQQ